MLLGIGAFLITLAALVRFYAAGQLIAAPADQYGITKLQAAGAQYFSIPDQKVLTGDLLITVTTRGDVKESKGDRVVWDEFMSVADATNQKPQISMSSRRSAFDKYTGRAVACCGTNIDGQPAEMSGQVYLFPFGTEKRTYEVFNSTARKAFPAQFVGEETVAGLKVYKFEQKVPATKTQTLSVPANLIGMEGNDEVQVDRVYEGTVTYYVEPTSGTPVRQDQSRDETLRTQDGVERSIAFRADAKMTDESIAELAAKARDAMNKITLIKTTMPLVLLVVGLVLAIGGIAILARRQARPAAARREEPRPEPAASSASSTTPASSATSASSAED
ncbi:DUF3068 domain-containing protein [Bailinhaonella thermotolerans]|uniref:DUF3068 domain-containing protein n=1 Tax=Bailinhaonella thermotolerans TaxID=1070861 RepID=UPI001F5B0C3B|nr:DUF3068 domain-containing protein [Bailinhaonella thermotolerans]